MQVLIYAEKSVDHKITLKVVFPSALFNGLMADTGKVMVKISR